MLRRLLSTIFLSLFFLFTSCFPFGEKEQSTARSQSRIGPSGNGEGFYGMLTLQNARVLCVYKETPGKPYLVTCRAAYADSEGNSLVASKIEAGVTLNWRSPERISGTEVKTASCLVSESSLSQECEITLAEGIADSRVQFGFNVANELVSRNETTIVHFPYSIKTYGLTPQVPAITNVDPEDPKKVQFNYRSFNPKETDFGVISSSCRMGERVFFSTDSQVYVLEKGIVKLYAGSANPNNINEFSHRLRTYITGNGGRIFMVCGDDVLYVVGEIRYSNTFTTGRLFKITDSSIRQIGWSTRFDPLESVNGITLVGSNLYVTSSLNRIVKIALPVNGNIVTASIVAEGLNSPQALTAGPNGILYFTEGNATQITKLSSEGIRSTLATFSQSRLVKADIQCSRDFRMVLAEDGSLLIPNQQVYNSFSRVKPNGEVSDLSIGLPSQRRICNLYRIPSGEMYFPSGSELWHLSNTLSATQVIGGESSTQAYLDNHAFPTIDDVEYAEDGSIYVLTTYSIRKIDKEGKGSIVATLPFNTRKSFVRTPEGVFYLAVFGQGLFQLTSGGTLTLLVPEGGMSSGDGGPASQATLYGLQSVVRDKQGNLYLSERFGDRIRRINTQGMIETIAGGGTLIGDGVQATLAQLGGPTALAHDGKGHLYFANAKWISQVDLQTGILTTVAGRNETVPGYSEGGLALERSIEPFALAYNEKEDRLYFTDFKSGALLYLVPETYQSTIRYRVFTFFGGQQQMDCGGGVIEGNATTSDALDNKFKASLSAICSAPVRALFIRTDCQSPSGSVHIVFSQQFHVNSGSGSQVLHTQRACPNSL